jgi:hypothetical protein
LSPEPLSLFGMLGLPWVVLLFDMNISCSVERLRTA